MLIFYVICIFSGFLITQANFIYLILFSDLGMLEDGMTSRDKQNLWAVIKISQDTAKAEEQGRQEQARQALQFDQVMFQLHFNMNFVVGLRLLYTVDMGCDYSAVVLIIC